MMELRDSVKLLDRALKIDAKQFGHQWAEERFPQDPTYRVFDPRCVHHKDLDGDAHKAYRSLVAASAYHRWQQLAGKA